MLSYRLGEMNDRQPTIIENSRHAEMALQNARLFKTVDDLNLSCIANRIMIEINDRYQEKSLK